MIRKFLYYFLFFMFLLFYLVWEGEEKRYIFYKRKRGGFMKGGILGFRNRNL